MAENQNPEQTKAQQIVDPENLRVKYNSLAAYSNAVVTFRFTTLGLYLTAVAIILAGIPSRTKFILLIIFTISLWTIEIRNRTIKNEITMEARKIQEIWKYTYGHTDGDYDSYPTKVFGIKISHKLADELFTHSIALDVLYFSVFVYALYQLIRLLFG